MKKAYFCWTVLFQPLLIVKKHNETADNKIEYTSVTSPEKTPLTVLYRVSMQGGKPCAWCVHNITKRLILWPLT